MKDKDKTKEQLVSELEDMRQRIAQLKKSEAEWKQAEQVLLNLEQRDRALLEETPLGIMSVDIKGKITYVNNAILENTGYLIDDLVGKNAFRLDLVTSETLSLLRRRLREKLMGEPPSPLIIQFKCKDGEWIWLEIRGKVLRKHGLPIGVQIIGENITERKQAEEALRKSEERFRRVFEEGPLGMTLVDLDLRYLDVNRRFCEMLGYTKREMMSRTFLDITHPERRDVDKENVNRLKKREIPYYQTEKRYIGKNGEVVWCDTIVTLVRNEDGTPTYFLAMAQDITQRKRVEKALKQSEDKFSKAFINSPEVVIISTINEGRFIEVNDSFTRFTGYTREEVIGKNAHEINIWARAEDRNKLTQLLEKEGRVNNEEFNFRKKSGEIATGLYSVEMIEIDNEPCLLSIVIDITERKQVEEALRESKEKMRAILNASPDLIHLLDSNGIILSANEAFAKRLGLGVDDVVGKNVFDYAPYESIHRRKEAIDKVFRMGEPLQLETKRLIEDKGLTGVFEACIHPVFNPEGEVTAVAVYARDITERKQAEEALRESEERLRAILDTSPDVIHLLDINGIILSANEGFSRRFGLGVDDVVGKNVFDYSPYESIHRRKEAINKVFKTGEPLQLEDKGLTGIFEAHIHPVFNPEGEVTAVAVYARDITERKQLEEERMKIEKLESVGTLAGGIAHDFNNILTGIMGNIGLAMRHVEPKSKAEERLLEAEKASIRARDLTQQLLTFSRGRAPIKNTTSVTGLLKESVGFALIGSNLRCDFDIPDDLWLVDIDEGQINQVITNLVINADQAMPEGGVLNIGARNTVIKRKGALPLPKGNYVEITIEDHGVGISKEHLDRIFDPYFTTKQKGSGLGLATTYSILKNHDGHITVKSQRDAGTTFSIYLPASKDQVSAKEEVIKEAPVRGGGKILVMDDEATIREMLSKVLSLAGYEVTLTGDGAEAIEQYAKAQKSGQPFGAVIMDLTIPGGMGGKEAIKKLLEINPDAKVIVSSGYATDPIMSEYKKYGFSAVVTKPYGIAQIVKALQSLLRKRE